MKEHKRLGFTIVELMIVIVVIAVLATITTIAYRETQKNARDEKRKADVMMLISAVDEYYANNGDYPKVLCDTVYYECWNNEAWQLLKNQGYLKNIPIPGDNITPFLGSRTNYGWLWSSPTSYGIFVFLESGNCKIGKNMTATWWSSIKTCDF